MSEKVEKSLVNTLKALPDLLRMEQTWGLLATLVRQLESENIVSILLNKVRRTGFVNSLTSLSNFKLNKIAPNLFISMWEIFGEREAIITEDKKFTWKEVKERVFILGNGLQSLGLKPKNKFAELLYNGNEFLESFLAGSLIGCPMPFLNWHMREEELTEVINRASPKALIFDEELIEIILSIKDRLKTVEHFIVVGERAPEGMILYEDLISKSSDEMPNTEFILALNPYTAGTTGVPKNVNYFDTFSYALSDIAEAP
ncbi:MAG TPA: AMP-binding protein [Halobacteria archaeon]|jgi:acyl-coenzyme A synthetase/AMP-(fatty) acid ligase|nr:AMP-binding protein [Halobacteria archaeon]